MHKMLSWHKKEIKGLVKQDGAAELRVPSLSHVQANDDDQHPEREKAAYDQQGHDEASQFCGVLDDRRIS